LAGLWRIHAYALRGISIWEMGILGLTLSFWTLYVVTSSSPNIYKLIICTLTEFEF